MRHCLAHLESDALKGKLPQGSNIVLLGLDSGLCIADHKISWLEIIDWLSDVHSCAARLADYLPTDAPDVTNAA